MSQFLKRSLYGEPKPQKRPRATLLGNKRIHVYSPKDNLTDLIKQLKSLAPNKPLNGAIRAKFEFLFTRPKSVTIKKRPHHIVKPDLSNLVKGLEDAMNTLYYKDDSQIISLILTKRYCNIGEEAGINITLEEY